MPQILITWACNMVPREKILVTGGAGFVGSHLCERLARNPKYEVYSLDNYLMGSRDNHVSSVTYLAGETSDIAKLVKFKPTVVYHLGEYSRVEQSFADVSQVWKSNMAGTLAVLEFVRKVGCKIIYAGSSTKFGDHGEGKFASPYAWSKAANTQLVENYGKWFGIKYAITYFYNVYGPREMSAGKYATLIAIFLEKTRRGEPLPVVNPGTQLRNFTHIQDIVDGLVLVGERGHGDGYGIGSEKSYSILEVAALFGGEVEMLPERAGNRRSAELVVEKTKGLGWLPKLSLDQYVAEALKGTGEGDHFAPSKGRS